MKREVSWMPHAPVGAKKGINSIQFNLIYLHANLTAKGQLQSEHVKKYRNDTQ
jgi:hypothetical protein